MNRTVHHIGMMVADLRVSTEFYELLGFEKTEFYGVRLRDAWLDAVYGIKNIDMVVGFVQLGSLLVELIEWNAPDNIKTKQTPLNAVGSYHIAVTVRDIESEFKRLKAAGVRFLSEELVKIPDQGFGTGDVSAALAYDPDGNTIELLNLPFD